MNRIASYVKLDFITVGPYFTPKNMLIYLIITAFIVISTQSVYMISGFIATLGQVYTAYPFAVGDQNGIDALYFTLPGNRRDVVFARYCYGISLSLAFSLVGLILGTTIGILMFDQFHFIELLATVGAIFLFVILLLSFQLPIYFKFGYMKARMLAYLPILIFICAALLLESSGIFASLVPWIIIMAHLPVFIAMLALVFFLFLLLSCFLSVRLYEQRDF